MQLVTRTVQHTLYPILYNTPVRGATVTCEFSSPTLDTHHHVQYLAAYAAFAPDTDMPLVTTAPQAARFIMFCMYLVARAPAEHSACGASCTRLSSWHIYDLKRV